MRKKRSFTLLELFITFTLVSSLLAFFFYWTYAHLLQKKTFETARWPLIEERYLSERIDRLLSTTARPTKSNEELEFYGEAERLVFTFDNGVFSHPLLSNRCRCFLERKNDRLECTLRPLSCYGNSPEITYLLFDRIEELQFTYYQPDDPLALTVNPEKVSYEQAPLGESIYWDKKWQQLPAYVKLTIQREGRLCTLYFDLNYPLTQRIHET